MLFHYINGALMAEIRIPGLTHNINGWTVHSYWRDRPTDPDYVDYGEEHYYGGYSHFVCESLSRTAAKRIVEGLGGYLVDDSYVPVGRQLGDGGPFTSHLFDIRAPYVLGEDAVIDDALDRAHLAAETWPIPYPVRIYDASGYMVIEITRDA